MSKILLMIFLGTLASCQVYHSDFDCPPSAGVPCTSVHEIEDMIIETEEGPNLFTGQKIKSALCIFKNCDGQFQINQKKVWVNPYLTNDGTYIEGHYVFLREE